MPLLYKYLDYKSYLKDLLAENTKKRGFISQLAEAAGCHRAYLSQVIHSHVHLTPEHACNIAHHLGLDESESEYFAELVNLARAGSRRLRERIQRKLDQLKLNAENLAKRTQAPVLDSLEVQSRYYSSWNWGAIHFLTSSPSYQTIGAIAARLNLAPGTVAQVLRGLKSMGLVREQGDRWSYQGGDLHLPRESPLNAANHMNWRSRALLDCQFPENGGIHYSSVFTIDVRDLEALKAQVLKLIDTQRATISASGCEELYCFTCDLFSP